MPKRISSKREPIHPLQRSISPLAISLPIAISAAAGALGAPPRGSTLGGKDAPASDPRLGVCTCIQSLLISWMNLVRWAVARSGSSERAPTHRPAVARDKDEHPEQDQPDGVHSRPKQR